jgi:hypothetical protein
LRTSAELMGRIYVQALTDSIPSSL